MINLSLGDFTKIGNPSRVSGFVALESINFVVVLLLSCPHGRRAAGVKLQPRFFQGSCLLLAQTSPGLCFFIAGLPAF
jgi:hypothetical protein